MPVAVLVPTMGRPNRVAAVTENILESCEHANAYFICEADDHATIDAVADTLGANLIINRNKRNYAGAINTGLHATDEPYLFAAADDLVFHYGWFEIAMEQMTDQIEVVGTNDLGNPEVLAGSHATHYLVARSYAYQGCVTMPDKMLCEEYEHNYCDTEFVQTAMSRGKFAPCLSAVVEHRHWAWGKATMDHTYEKGARTVATDHARFMARRYLWT